MACQRYFTERMSLPLTPTVTAVSPSWRVPSSEGRLWRSHSDITVELSSVDR